VLVFPAVVVRLEDRLRIVGCSLFAPIVAIVPATYLPAFAAVVFPVEREQVVRVDDEWLIVSNHVGEQHSRSVVDP
jgi:hypothetical protein